MARKVRLFSIASVQLAILESKPPKLAVTVHGYAVSSGWTDPELVPLEKTLSADGILDLDFVATPPDSVSLPMLTPATAETVWTDNVDRLVGVRVVSRSGDVIELLPSDAAQTTTQPAAEETTQIAGEGPHPYWAAAARATTLAVGEETRATTFPTSEEGTNTTQRMEAVFVDPHGPMATERAPATTMVVGEEGRPPVSTMATGEETVFKTFEIGEESHPEPTNARSPFVEKPPQGEVFSAPELEDPPTTPPFGEEHPPTHPGPFIEKGPQGEVASAPELETMPMTTLIVGEETPPTTAPSFEEGVVTTNVVGEDIFARPGPGRPTTLVVGEETVGKRPWGETNPRWDNPKVPWGETSPHSDDPKPALGETWFDPQDMNPLGRR